MQNKEQLLPGCSPDPGISTLKVALKTLGCAKNETDSDRMRSLLRNAGYQVEYSHEDADAIVLNTCGFLVSAVEEGIETILELLELRKDNNVPLVVTGCMPSRYTDTGLHELLPEVSGFLDTQHEDEIVEKLDKLLNRSSENLPIEVKRTIEAAHGYIKISEGCSRNCAFCAIPFIRGPYRSRPSQELLNEAAFLLEGGVREIVLIGQDTGIWGRDLSEGHDIAWLIEQIANLVTPYGGWVRVLYLQPEGLTDHLINVLAHTPSVVPYIDMPIQHSSGAVLKRMHRSGDETSLRNTFTALKKAVPNIVLRTTLIAGYPGETEEEVLDLIQFIEEMEFDFCGVFMYSPEEGTHGAQLPNQIPDEIRLDRTQRLRDAADAVGFSKAAERVGSVARVLVDSFEEMEEGKTVPVGRAWFQSPDDLDGIVYLPDEDLAVGDMVDVMLDEAICYDFVGHQV